MALTNYTELLAAVESVHHRSTAFTADAVTLAEKRINNRLFSRESEAEIQLTATQGSRYIALPSQFLSTLALWLTTYGARTEIIYVTPENLPVNPATQGRPSYYTIDGSNIAFEYECNEAHTFDFRYRKGYNLAATSTNQVLTNYPAVYLYGALREVSLYAQDNDNANKYEALFQQALDECASVEFANKSQAVLTVEAPLMAPARINILVGDM